MFTKITRFILSIVLGAMLFMQAPEAGVIASQAAASPSPQWLETDNHLLGGSSENAMLGKAIAISANGNIFIAGAEGTNDTVGANEGMPVASIRSGIEWSRENIFPDDREAGKHFGNAVAINMDGSTVLVGAYQDTISGHVKQGAVYVMTHSGTDWNQQAKLTATSGAAQDFFGASVALSGLLLGLVLVFGIPFHLHIGGTL